MLFQKHQELIDNISIDLFEPVLAAHGSKDPACHADAELLLSGLAEAANARRPGAVHAAAEQARGEGPMAAREQAEAMTKRLATEAVSYTHLRAHET